MANELGRLISFPLEERALTPLMPCADSIRSGLDVAEGGGRVKTMRNEVHIQYVKPPVQVLNVEGCSKTKFFGVVG